MSRCGLRASLTRGLLAICLPKLLQFRIFALATFHDPILRMYGKGINFEEETMFITLVMTRGEAKTYTIEFKPPEEQSDPVLDGLYPDSEWLSGMPFDTAGFILIISDRPLDDALVAIKLPPIPFARSTKTKTRFEMLNDRGRRLLSSKENPVTQLFLYNAVLDRAIIDERKSIYLGISPLSASAADHDQDDHDEGDRARDRAAAMEYLNNFVRCHVLFSKGGKLTSLQILSAILNIAPDNVPTEYIHRAHITRAVKAHHDLTMEKTSTRIDGRNQKFWKDLTILLD